MTRNEFLSALAQKLYGVPEKDKESSLEYYGEMINDRIEEGMTEEEAVAALGSPEEIATQILRELPLPKLVQARVKPRRALRAWEIVLLILGAPVWLPLLLAAAVVILAIYVVLWSLVVSLAAVNVSVAAVSLVGFTGAVAFLAEGGLADRLVMLGMGLVGAGLSILLFFGVRYAAQGVIWLGKKIWQGLKFCLIRREAAQ
ncbi:MAG: DUF1700 domain-containing protein [Clostridia bacterium]|nr:DUF1700 domain-containing protein [Clostridia bacterium]